MNRSSLNAVALALALAAAYALGHNQGVKTGWQEGFAASSQKWQQITADITGHMDDEQEETDTAGDEQ